MSASRSQKAVIDAAHEWWRSRRPVSFDLDWHLEHPTINCGSDAEEQLAREVVRYIQNERAKAKMAQREDR